MSYSGDLHSAAAVYALEHSGAQTVVCFGGMASLLAQFELVNGGGLRVLFYVVPVVAWRPRRERDPERLECCLPHRPGVVRVRV
jgi:hypothetical protein